MTAYFKCRPARNTSIGGHVAWCGFQPLTATDAIGEKQEPVFSEFGRTEAEAIACLKSGLDRQGITEWKRQAI